MPDQDIASVLNSYTASLSDAGIPSPRVDAELIIGHVLQKTRGEVAVAELLGTTISADDQIAADRIVNRRLQREPLQHILGSAHFRKIELLVGDGVFVPRPETEGLVQHGLDFLAQHYGGKPDQKFRTIRPKVIDFGTGSGAIALSLAYEFPTADVVAVEKSAEAFAWATKNFSALNLPNATLLHGEIKTIFPTESGTAHAIVSNPPYIPLGMIPRDLEVRKYDPDMALFSGEDGLDAVRELALRAKQLLVSAGLIVIEHGELQGEAIRNIFTEAGLIQAQTLPDLTGRDRYTKAFQPVTQKL